MRGPIKAKALNEKYEFQVRKGGENATTVDCINVI